jgi:hypothetical protein
VLLLRLEFDFGLLLVDGSHLRTGRPYPNKWYSVGCRKIGRKAIDGILIELPFREKFSYTAHWAIEAQLVVAHRVDYTVLDRDFDAVSDSMIFWHACCAELGGWSNRVPKGWDRKVPLASEPMMEVVPDRVDRRRKSDDMVEGDWIVARHECFSMPTIERERIFQTGLRERTPGPELVLRLN